MRKGTLIVSPIVSVPPSSAGSWGRKKKKKVMFYFAGTKLFAMTLKARGGSAPLLVLPSQGIEVSVAAISANDLGEQTLVS